MENQSQTQLVTLRGLAQRLRRFGLTATWLRDEAEAGRIPSMRAGRRMLFNVEAVERALIRRAAGEGDLSTPDDPDLKRIVAAWPTLPAAVRAGIVAMVNATK